MTASSRPLTASIYVRLSREARDSNISVPGMIADCRALAEREGLSVLAVHVDNGKSGAVRDRPEFVAWLDDARTGAVDVMIASHADRLTREGVNAAAQVLDVVEGKDPNTGAVVRAPVRLVTVDGLDSERDAEAFRWRFVIAAEVARAERERIKARNKATAKRLREAGRARGPAPFGCSVVERDGGKYLVRNEEEARALEEVAERLIRGDSYRAVVGWLNASGYRTRRGKEWIRSSLRETLRSEATRTHVLPASISLALPAVLEPKKRGTGAKRSGRPPRFLTRGVAVCGSCGRNMTTSAGRYICASSAEGSKCPRVVSIKADAADDFVSAEILARFGHLDRVEHRVVISGAEDVATAEEAVRDAERALLADLTPENMAAVQEARAALEEAKSAPQERKVVEVPTGETVADWWKTADVLEKRAFLADVTDGPIAIRPTVDGFPGYEYGRRGAIVEVERRISIPWVVDYASRADYVD